MSGLLNSMRNPVAIYIPDFSGGGAEMVSVRLANQIALSGREVDLVVNRDRGVLKDLISSNVQIVDLGVSRTIAALPKLISYINHFSPGALVSGILTNNVVAIAAHVCTLRKVPVIVCQHNTFSIEARQSFKYFMTSCIFAIMIRFCTHIIAVSRGVADDLVTASGIARSKVKVIYNPILIPSFDELANQANHHPWLNMADEVVFIAAGRLAPQKDYPTLLKGFAIVRKTIDAKLIVLGEGLLLKELQREAEILKISESVDFAGFQPNPLSYISKACALVLTSSFEGFGNVVAEALGCGTQVISTTCSGPVEILENGRHGQLVPIGDHEALAHAMLRAACVPAAKNQLKAAASRFRTDLIARQYLELIDKKIQVNIYEGEKA